MYILRTCVLCCAEIVGTSQEERGKEDGAVPESDRKLRLSLNSCSVTLSYLNLTKRCHPASVDMMHSFTLIY